MTLSLAHRTVLVIDDEPSVCEMICEFVDLFHGAAVGCTAIDPRSLFLFGVDVVLIDLMLSGHYSGIEIAQHLRTRGYAGPMVALSASDGMLELSQQSDLFAATIAKPFETTHLYNTLLELIGTQGA